jgi:hypothetical protein
MRLKLGLVFALHTGVRPAPESLPECREPLEQFREGLRWPRLRCCFGNVRFGDSPKVRSIRVGRGLRRHAFTVSSSATQRIASQLPCRLGLPETCRWSTRPDLIWNSRSARKAPVGHRGGERLQVGQPMEQAVDRAQAQGQRAAGVVDGSSRGGTDHPDPGSLTPPVSVSTPSAHREPATGRTKGLISHGRAPPSVPVRVLPGSRKNIQTPILRDYEMLG